MRLHSERSPLSGPPASAVSRKVPSTRPIDIAVSVLLPWLVFSLIVCLYAFAYQDFAPLVWALVVASLLLAMLFVAMGASAGRPVQLGIGFCILMSVSTAVPVGLYVETGFMLDFWHLDNGASYHKLSASEPGSSHSDAALLEFTTGTTVDTKRSLGYMKRGVVYCVAPVLSARPSEDVGPAYWAVGTDCCKRLGGFSCGEVKNPAALGGVAIPDADGNYAAAVRMATSTFGLEKSPSKPVFLQWTADARRLKDDLWSSAAIVVVVSSTIHFCVSALAGFFLARMKL